MQRTVTKRSRDAAGLSYAKKGAPKTKKYRSVQQVPRAPRTQVYIPQRPSEIKIKDVFTGIGNPLNQDAPTILDMCEIAGGSGISQRIGNKIQPTGFQFTISVVGHGTGVSAAAVRIVLIQDYSLLTEAIGADTIEYYFNDAMNDAGPANGVLPWMPKNFARQSTFRVLHDEVGFVVSQPNANSSFIKHFYVKPKGGMKQVAYQGTASTIDNNAGGRVFLLVFTNIPAADTAYCTAFGRMYYRDN